MIRPDALTNSKVHQAHKLLPGLLPDGLAFVRYGPSPLCYYERGKIGERVGRVPNCDVDDWIPTLFFKSSYYRCGHSKARSQKGVMQGFITGSQKKR